MILKNQPLNITHLAFVDDIILFCQGSTDGLAELLRILNSFSCVSRQKINFFKSYVIFNKHAFQNLSKTLVISLTCPRGEQDAYLGIFFHTQKQIHIYQTLLQKVTLKVASEKRHYPSKVGRLTMIKSIFQPVPLHLMPCLKIPQTICNLLE